MYPKQTGWYWWKFDETDFWRIVWVNIYSKILHAHNSILDEGIPLNKFGGIWGPRCIEPNS